MSNNLQTGYRRILLQDEQGGEEVAGRADQDGQPQAEAQGHPLPQVAKNNLQAAKAG